MATLYCPETIPITQIQTQILIQIQTLIINVPILGQISLPESGFQSVSGNVIKPLGKYIYLTENDKIFPMIPIGINPPKYDLSMACPVKYMQFRISKIEVIKDHQEILI